MNLHFGIRTINQTRQIKQLCSLKETREEKITIVITEVTDVIKNLHFIIKKEKNTNSTHFTNLINFSPKPSFKLFLCLFQSFIILQQIKMG